MHSKRTGGDTQVASKRFQNQRGNAGGSLQTERPHRSQAADRAALSPAPWIAKRDKGDAGIYGRAEARTRTLIMATMVLDAYALMVLFNDERGAEEIEKILIKPESGSPHLLIR